MPVVASPSMTMVQPPGDPTTPMREKLFQAMKLSGGSGWPLAVRTSTRCVLPFTTISITSSSASRTEVALRRTPPPPLVAA